MLTLKAADHLNQGPACLYGPLIHTQRVMQKYCSIQHTCRSLAECCAFSSFASERAFIHACNYTLLYNYTINALLSEELQYFQ